MTTDPHYREVFRRYEQARERAAAFEEEVRRFLSRFSGDAAAGEKPFVIRDFAHMLGLREARDKAHAEFSQAEETLFKLLSRPWE